ncbi:RDD family protein [Kiloniella litopenaei]|uniref:RDD family protein n=1 Tax=Kiloniella litopenaei TaxID=1549748 RepID=UPI000696CD3A|nr:RDD family protein [Kiloniella litopenaei]
MEKTVTSASSKVSERNKGQDNKLNKGKRFAKRGYTKNNPTQWRRVVTPEGVPVSFQLASRGDRVAAVLLDLMIVYGLPILLLVGFLFSGVWENLLDKKEAIYVLISIVTVVLFLWYNFYFSYFEIKWQGRTPGKRALGIRVVDRHGGQLKPDAVFARNLMRELELFLPLTMLFSPVSSGVDGVINLLVWIWLGVFIFLPFFNKDRLRAGDMIAGTWVVKIPKTNLLGDIVQDKDILGITTNKLSTTPGKEQGYSFSEEQVDAYGIYELQTLEELLRKPEVTPKTIKEVAERIKTKIKWVEPVADKGASFYWKNHKGSTEKEKEFLKAYYAALRKRLEAKMLLGVRRENKYDKT